MWQSARIPLQPLLILVMVCFLASCSQEQHPSSPKQVSSHAAFEHGAANEPPAINNARAAEQPTAANPAVQAAHKNRPPTIEEIRFNPSPPVTGDEVRATVKTDHQSEDIKTNFVWKVNGVTIQDSSEEVLRHPVKAGDLIEVEARASNVDGEGETAMHSIYVANAAPNLKLTDESVDGSSYRARLEATDPEGDPVVFSIKEAPPGMSLDAEKGLITWPLQGEEKADCRVKIAASDPSGAETTIAFQLKIKWEQADRKDGQKDNESSAKN